MKEHGMLLSPPMALARKEQRKTQTRRRIGAYNCLVDGRGVSAKNWDRYGFDFGGAWVDPGPSPAGNPGPYLKVNTTGAGYATMVSRIYPRVQVGDRIWWKETYAETDSDGGPCIVYPADGEVWYVGATDEKRIGTWQQLLLAKCDANPHQYTKKSSMFMPRWASRFQDVVTRVRVERVQEITEADAIAEGVQWNMAHRVWQIPCTDILGDTAVKAYAMLFDSINGAGAWKRNEWVWVYEWEFA